MAQKVGRNKIYNEYMRDICHREINRKQTSLRCNHSEHWVHLRCAHIRVDQYTDTHGYAIYIEDPDYLTQHTPHHTFPWPVLNPSCTHHPPHLTPNTNIHQTRRRPPLK